MRTVHISTIDNQLCCNKVHHILNTTASPVYVCVGGMCVCVHSITGIRHVVAVFCLVVQGRKRWKQIATTSLNKPTLWLDALPVTQHIVSKGKCITFHELAHTGLTCHLSNCFLTTLVEYLENLHNRILGLTSIFFLDVLIFKQDYYMTDWDT